MDYQFANNIQRRDKAVTSMSWLGSEAEDNTDQTPSLTCAGDISGSCDGIHGRSAASWRLKTPAELTGDTVLGRL